MKQEHRIMEEYTAKKISDLKKHLEAIERYTLLAAKKVLTLEDVALYTGLSKSYLYKLTCYNQIPHYKPNGRVLYFDKKEIEDWMKQNRVTTMQEAEPAALKYILKEGGKKIDLSSYFVRQFTNNVYDCVNHIVGILMGRDLPVLLQMPCFKEIDKEVTQLNQYIRENNDVKLCKSLLTYRMVWGEVLRRVDPQKENELFKKLHEVDKTLFNLQNWYLKTFYNVSLSAIKNCEYFVDDVTGEVKRSSTGEVITEPLQNDAKYTSEEVEYGLDDIFSKAVKDVVAKTECSWICREGETEEEEEAGEKYQRYRKPIRYIIDKIYSC